MSSGEAPANMHDEFVQLLVSGMIHTMRYFLCIIFNWVNKFISSAMTHLYYFNSLTFSCTNSIFPHCLSLPRSEAVGCSANQRQRCGGRRPRSQLPPQAASLPAEFRGLPPQQVRVEYMALRFTASIEGLSSAAGIHILLFNTDLM